MPSVEVREHSGEVFANSRQRFEGPFWNALLRLIADQEEDYSRQIDLLTTIVS